MLIAKMSVTPGGPIMIDDKAVTGKPVSQDPIVKKKDPVKTGKPTKPRPIPNMSTDNGGPIMVDETAVTGPLNPPAPVVKDAENK
ncbi:hypothetical protein AXX17_AT4G18770 [Arabidopsis thaliana]|uniref:Uncharacterized protein n=1 Tax=Arabidopsis thaliana TaxID=3702 RepID=A0A178V0U6_ARATH|nr:hypothetical protein AXX17_AT4G18770 [Arabidopsis thaliana]